LLHDSRGNDEIIINDDFRRLLEGYGYLLDERSFGSDGLVNVTGFGFIFRRLFNLSRVGSSRSMKEIHVLLPEDMHDVLREMSKEMGVSLAELVRRFIANGLGMGVGSERRNLVRELDELREEVESIKEWQKVIDNKLDVIVSNLGGGASLSNSTDDFSSSKLSFSGVVEDSVISDVGIVSNVRGSSQVSSRSSPPIVSSLRSRSGSRYESVILEVMRSDPLRVWHWEEIYDGVVTKLGEANRSTVKDRVNRMSKDGLLVKVGRGRYMLPPVSD